MSIKKALILSDIEFKLLSQNIIDVIQEEEKKFKSWKELKEYLIEELELILEHYKADNFLVTTKKELTIISKNRLAKKIIEENKESLKEFVEEEI